MNHLASAVVVSLVLVCSSWSQSLAPGKSEFILSKLAKKPNAKGDVMISVAVAPAPDIAKSGFALCFFAPADPQASIGKFTVSGGEFNWAFAQNGKPESWSSRIRDLNNNSLGPLTCIRLSADYLGKGVVTVRANDVETSDSFGIPRSFPMDGKVEIAIARVRWAAKEREGLAKGEPIFLLASNVISMGAAK